MEDIQVRKATVYDAEQILGIYEPYVINTAITFEYDVPSLEEFRDRIENILKKYPYLVAVKNGDIIGYAYADQFHSREAYDHSVELSVYVDNKIKRRHIDSILYNSLEKELKKIGILNLYACIAYSETEDKYLTQDSVRFHEKMGFCLVGRFHKCGYKFDQWYDMVYMEKLIGEHI